jgi:hypothetical protein
VKLLDLPVQKQDEVVIISQSLYWASTIVTAASFEHLYIITCAAAYYPASSDYLHRNTECYPILQITSGLMDKHGPDEWEDFYQFPGLLHADYIDEGVFRGLNEMEDALEYLSKRLGSTNVCSRTERDFCYRGRFACAPVEGDKAMFLGVAKGALTEERIQIGSGCERLLAKDEVALVTAGMALTTVEGQDPYRTYRGGGRSTGSERSLGASYA